MSVSCEQKTRSKARISPSLQSFAKSCQVSFIRGHSWYGLILWKYHPWNIIHPWIFSMEIHGKSLIFHPPKKNMVLARPRLHQSWRRGPARHRDAWHLGNADRSPFFGETYGKTWESLVGLSWFGKSFRWNWNQPNLLPSLTGVFSGETGVSPGF